MRAFTWIRGVFWFHENSVAFFCLLCGYKQALCAEEERWPTQCVNGAPCFDLRRERIAALQVSQFMCDDGGSLECQSCVSRMPCLDCYYHGYSHVDTLTLQLFWLCERQCPSLWQTGETFVWRLWCHWVRLPLLFWTSELSAIQAHWTHTKSVGKPHFSKLFLRSRGAPLIQTRVTRICLMLQLL